MLVTGRRVAVSARSEENVHPMTSVAVAEIVARIAAPAAAPVVPATGLHQARPGFRCDEMLGPFDQRRHERLTGDPRCLPGDEQSEGEEVEAEVEQRHGEADRQHRSDRVERTDEEPMAAPGAVDQRTDKRGEEGEWDQVDDEVEQHLVARRLGADAEEQRTGERDGDEPVPGGGEGYEQP